jgi:hypothetical protein
MPEFRTNAGERKSFTMGRNTSKEGGISAVHRRRSTKSKMMVEQVELAENEEAIPCHT